MSASKSSVDDYIKKHRIGDLFGHMCAVVTHELPENPKDRILQELRSIHGGTSCESKIQNYHGLLLDEEELTAVFNGLDQNDKGSISSDDARMALQTIAVSREVAEEIDMLDIPKYVDRGVFIQFARQLTQINHSN